MKQSLTGLKKWRGTEIYKPAKVFDIPIRVGAPPIGDLCLASGPDNYSALKFVDIAPISRIRISRNPFKAGIKFVFEKQLPFGGKATLDMSRLVNHLLKDM